MILISLVIKELLYFFRSKSNVATMFIFPAALIIIMGFSLNGLMNVDFNIFENKKVYYKVNNLSSGNEYLQVFKSFKDTCEESMKIEFEELSDDIYGKNRVNSYEGLALIYINEDKYDFYRNEKKESRAQKIFRSVFDQYLERYSVINTVVSENPRVLNDMSEEKNIVVEEGISASGINSFTYYTFAELVLIILYISQITSVSVYNEGFENTFLRLKVSKAGDFSIILSKIILGVIVGILQVIIVYFISTVFLKIDWGINLMATMAVLTALIVFSSILGITVGCVFKDAKIAASVLNTLLIVFGFLGGAYLPISLIKSNEIASMLCKIAPSYWANIALLSLSSGIPSNYQTISVLLSLQLSAVLLIICIICSLRAGENNV
ncbi:ABC transporter permease [Clostridium sp. NSJ-145]|uniref:ABC transporter permease n=1 Tax=Clostridium sp. NSJ-145 TaxID=2897777 RepID=UPI001E63EC42|nr:ABC transporter permease [Clostridium sp. NSJ-145]MCD2503108.1 ABC transporter permease [Clostridium sp. NSJ-145]